MASVSPDDQVASARAAAVAFARRHGYSEDEIRQIDAEPILGPVTFDRNGVSIVAYRWIGAGRGSAYVQVEIGAGSEIAVLGARSASEFPAWVYHGQ